MADEKSMYDKTSILFSQLVLSFQASAMQQMGKLKNPFTDKIERNLSQAQMSIDMLAMLQEKTKGNVTDEESRFLDHVLFELRMNFLEEVEKDTREGEEAARKEEKAEEEETAKREEIAEGEETARKEQKAEEEETAKREEIAEEEETARKEQKAEA